jgi:hypothetical protein
MEANKQQKPFILEIDEAKSEIIQVINNAIQVHKLPCCILDMILSEIGAQIKEGAKNELAMARAQMENEEVA